MKVARQTPRAINKPLLFLGFDRRVVGHDVLLYVLLVIRDGWMIAGGVCVLILGSVKWLMRKDDHALTIGLELFKLKTHYDPAKREVFRP